MPLIDITNPDVIKFLVESYEKTTRLKLKWNRLHGEKLEGAATLNREERGYYETDVFKDVMVEGMATITRDNVVAACNRRLKAIRDGTHVPGVADLRKGHSIVEVGLGDAKEDPKLSRLDTDLTIDPVMRPVEEKERQIIYKDLPFYGREVYLKSRSQKKPEQKYYFMETSGWEYGWRLKDSSFSRNAPQCGRVWRLTRDVKSRTGPHPDPYHYREADIPGPAKCMK